MRKLSILSLTAVASIMMAGVPAISSQASMYSFCPPSGVSGNGGNCPTAQNCPTGGNSQNCDISQGSSTSLPGTAGSGQVQFFKGQIIRQSLPTGETTKPEQPGTGENKPELPGTGGSRPEQPGGGVETPDTPDAGSFAEEVLALVNEERAKAGAAALTLDSDAQEAADVRAEEIKSSFSHTRPNGSNFSTALTEAGVRYSASGENIAYGQNDPQEVMNGWMNSSGHRANILSSSFTSIGIGHSQTADGVDYWTQLFFR